MRIYDLIDNDNTLRNGDIFAIEIDDDLIIESVIVGFMQDGVVIQGDDVVLSYLKTQPIKESITKFTEME